MPNLGIKVSLPGFDVKRASPEQCSIHSGFDTFKVNSHANPPHFGIIELTILNNPPVLTRTNVFSIPHGYGYRPSVLSYIDAGTNGLALGYAFGSPASFVSGRVLLGNFNGSYIECYTTDAELRIDIQRRTLGDDLTGASLGGYPTVMNIRYYIFSEDGD